MMSTLFDLAIDGANVATYLSINASQKNTIRSILSRYANMARSRGGN